MAKIELDRLMRKFGYTGGKYRSLMNKILRENTNNLQSKVGFLSEQHYKNANKKVKATEKKFILPSLDEVIPDKSLMIRKVAERGNLITDELRENISSNLRDVMKEFTPKTGEPKYIRRRGVKAGTINPKLIQSLETSIGYQFANYTKKDPRYGMPSNIHTIAVTELRSTVNEMKSVYATEFLRKNPDVESRKRWIHNKSLSKNPRKYHMAMDGKSVPFDKPFILGNGARLMHPHDPQAEAKETISCNCDWVIYMTRRKKIQE